MCEISAESAYLSVARQLPTAHGTADKVEGRAHTSDQLVASLISYAHISGLLSDEDKLASTSPPSASAAATTEQVKIGVSHDVTRFEMSYMTQPSRPPLATGYRCQHAAAVDCDGGYRQWMYIWVKDIVYNLLLLYTVSSMRVRRYPILQNETAAQSIFVVVYFTVLRRLIGWIKNGRKLVNAWIFGNFSWKQFTVNQPVTRLIDWLLD